MIKRHMIDDKHMELTFSFPLRIVDYVWVILNIESSPEFKKAMQKAGILCSS